MKQISEEETDFLFEWVKNWYPTPKKPKVVILLLNEREWRRLYENTRRIRKQEFDKRMDIFVREKPELKQLVERLEHLTEEQRRELMAKAFPHGIVEGTDKIDYWMNEVSGECFSINDVKGFAEISQIGIDDFFAPYLDNDFVIIISDFLNREQKRMLQTKEKRKLFLYNNIFHELIHVVEACNQELIFKTNDVSENNKNTGNITRRYFDSGL